MLFQNPDVFTQKALWPKVDYLDTLMQFPLYIVWVTFIVPSGAPIEQVFSPFILVQFLMDMM